MSIGLSTYSLQPEINSKRMKVSEVITWIAEHGGEHVEIVPFGFELMDRESGEINKSLIADINDAMRYTGIYVSNYSVLADLCSSEKQEYFKEINRLKVEAEIAAMLGAKTMRHDVCAFRRPHEENSIGFYERLLPQMIEGVEKVAAHAKKYGVTTLVENHGFFANGADRINMLLNRVRADNYGLLFDSGNVCCVDEDPVVAARKLAPLAKKAHIKDFYIRSNDPGDAALFDCSGSWFRSSGGMYLRGSIFGQGDLDVRAILSELKKSGYKGDLTIEFEGMEDCKYASKVSLDNAKRIWNEV